MSASAPRRLARLALLAFAAAAPWPAPALPCQTCEPPDEVDPTPPPPPPPPLAGDGDLDGLVDSYEDALLARFAPRIWLHGSENRFPVNVDWLLSQATLRYSHSYCSDDQIIPWWGVTRANLTTQLHKDKRNPLTSWPWDACEHYGSSHPSNSHEGGTRDTFFLQFTDAAHRGLMFPGSWDVYGHVFRAGTGEIVIQYWQLYGYNDSFGSANHEGDWEYTAVVIDGQEVPRRVIFFRHDRDVVHPASDVEWAGEHHVTFSSKGSHGQYRGMTSTAECDGNGILDRAQGFSDNCERAYLWDTWNPANGRIVNVGEKFHPLNGSGWIRYSGLWGEVGAAAVLTIDFTSGPRGPAYKASWYAH
jgi:hypothetical protein